MNLFSVFPKVIERLGVAILTLLVMCSSMAWSQQLSCNPVSTGYDFKGWSNPHPDIDDVSLPLGTLKFFDVPITLSFRKVVVSGTSFFGDEKAVFESGADVPTVFEAQIPVRVASALSDNDRSHFLLAGKYEVSIAQYAFVIGSGDLAAGLRSSRLSVEEPLAGFVAQNGPCANIVTEPVAKILALPITGMTETEYRNFVTAANLLCFAQESCSNILAQFSNNPQIPANLRLPANHEWEYIARGGGGNFMATSKLVLPLGQSIRDIANFSPPNVGEISQLHAIGTTKPYLGFYDIYGNASELTLGYFLSETVSGGVGGIQARGGNITTNETELRPSAVEELKPYTLATGTNTLIEAPLLHAGLRLLLSAPLASAASRIGSDELARIYAATFSEIGTGKDRAGNTFLDAKAMREIKSQSEFFEDELDSSDTKDFFRFPLNKFANAKIQVSSNAPVVVDIFDEARRLIMSFRTLKMKSGFGELTEKLLPGLLPGKYYVSIEPKSPPSEGNEITYALAMLAENPLDTGLSGNEIGREAFAGKQSILSVSKLKFDGYVGADDQFDTFPVELVDGYDAVTFGLDSLSTNLEIRVLDSRGQKLQSRLMDGSVESTYPIPLPAKAKVFMQVVAVDGQPTTYSLTATPALMFDKNLSISNKGPAVDAISKEFSGYLHESAKSLYYLTRLSERKKLRVELSGLDADVDLVILDSSGKAISSSHRQVGAEPEIFIKDLPAGDYVVELDRKSGAGTIAPFNLAVSQEQALAMTVTDLKELKEMAKSLVIGSNQTLSPGNSVVYYYFEAPPVLQAYDITFSITRNSAARVTFETADGSVISVENDVSFQTIKYYDGPSTGRTYIRLEFAKEPPSSISIKIQNNGLMPERQTGFENIMKSVEELGDWKVALIGSSCMAFTYATDIAPAQGWVKERPYFRISVDLGGNGAGIIVADEGDFDSTKSTSVTVRDSKGRQKAVPLIWSIGFLRPVVYDKRAKGYFLNSNAIRQIIGGVEIQVIGKTKSGLAAKLTYSLRGIGDATRTLVKLCKMKSNVFK